MASSFFVRYFRQHCRENCFGLQALQNEETALRKGHVIMPYSEISLQKLRYYWAENIVLVLILGECSSFLIFSMVKFGKH